MSLVDRIEAVESNFETVQESLTKLRRGIMGNRFKQGVEKKVETMTQQSKENGDGATNDDKKDKTEGESDSEYGMMGGGGGVGGPAFDALEKRVDNLSKGIGFAESGELPDWMKPKDPADEDPNLRLPGNLYCKYTLN